MTKIDNHVAYGIREGLPAGGLFCCSSRRRPTSVQHQVSCRHRARAVPHDRSPSPS